MTERKPERRNRRRTPDTSEYSASKAAETRPLATQRETVGDPRLIPGGEHGAAAEIGMSAMDRDDVPSEAEDLGLTNIADTPDRDKSR